MFNLNKLNSTESINAAFPLSAFNKTLTPASLFDLILLEFFLQKKKEQLQNRYSGFSERLSQTPEPKRLSLG